MLEKAALAGQLCVSPKKAARSILAADVGVTLMLIAEPWADRDFDLSDMTHGEYRTRRHSLPRLRPGIEKISDAMADPGVQTKVRAVPEGTKALLVKKRECDEA